MIAQNLRVMKERQLITVGHIWRHWPSSVPFLSKMAEMRFILLKLNVFFWTTSYVFLNYHSNNFILQKNFPLIAGSSVYYLFRKDRMFEVNKALSTRLGYFKIRIYFVADLKLLASSRNVFELNSPVHTYPAGIRIHCSAQYSSVNIVNRACVKQRVWCNVRIWRQISLFCH